ncbi:hypothetical protein P280DRAFT_114097 [Massarina eburnea CBS 473.64]|uniref:Uncharacterized protein n=1 Tax=Massarina eburnea CBS 473.64 TaxID=1395130 RepID=A0A6A6RPH4_9PLEO|nr:hypothetical protein P280DRAFT_114097 [Massarina eburnea CBS 473.64]
MTSPTPRLPTAAAPDSPFALPLWTPRDYGRLALFVLIPIYSRIYFFASGIEPLKAVCWQICGIIMVIHEAAIPIDPSFAWELLRSFVMCAFPAWVNNIPISRWFVADLYQYEWQWEIFYWAFAAKSLVHYLPAPYGSEIQVRHCLSLEPFSATNVF